MKRTILTLVTLAILAGCQHQPTRPYTRMDLERDRIIIDAGMELMRQGMGAPYCCY